jgi:hypothetical protein
VPYLFLTVGEVLNYTIKREVMHGTIREIDLLGASEVQTITEWANDTSLSI